jgi:hypothetical protein
MKNRIFLLTITIFSLVLWTCKKEIPNEHGPSTNPPGDSTGNSPNTNNSGTGAIMVYADDYFSTICDDISVSVTSSDGSYYDTDLIYYYAGSYPDCDASGTAYFSGLNKEKTYYVNASCNGDNLLSETLYGLSSSTCDRVDVPISNISDDVVFYMTSDNYSTSRLIYIFFDDYYKGSISYTRSSADCGDTYTVTVENVESGYHYYRIEDQGGRDDIETGSVYISDGSGCNEVDFYRSSTGFLYD